MTRSCHLREAGSLDTQLLWPFSRGTVKKTTRSFFETKEGFLMRKKLRFVPILVLALVIGGSFLLPRVTGSQESQREQCEQACTKQYQECRGDANANEATCKAAHLQCRKECQEVIPHASPSPTLSPSDAPSPTPSPSPTASPSPTVSPSESPSPTPSPDASPSPTH